MSAKSLVARAAVVLDHRTVGCADQNMLEKALLAFTTFFATIGPLNAAALFPALTPHNTAPERRRMARYGCLLGGGILTFFALVGHEVLVAFGIGLPALRTAGGVLLLLIAIDMVFARPSGGTTTTEDEQAEAATKQDISVFPLATPLIAGPGAIGAAILLAADVRSNPVLLAVVIPAPAQIEHGPGRERILARDQPGDQAGDLLELHEPAARNLAQHIVDMLLDSPLAGSATRFDHR